MYMGDCFYGLLVDSKLLAFLPADRTFFSFVPVVEAIEASGPGWPVVFALANLVPVTAGE
jgi:hypothetical protein